MQRDGLRAGSRISDQDCKSLRAEEVVDLRLAGLVELLAAVIIVLDQRVKFGVGSLGRGNAPVNAKGGAAEALLDQRCELLNVADEGGPDHTLLLSDLQLLEEIEGPRELGGKLAQLTVALQPLQHGSIANRGRRNF